MQGPSVFHILAAAVCMSVCICVFCGGGVYTMLLGQERGVWGWKCGPSVIGSEPNVTLCVSLCLCDAEEYKYSPLSVLTHTRTHSFPLQTYELSSQRKKLRIKLCASGLFLRRLQVLNQDFAETTLRWILMQVPHAVGLLHPSWLWTPAFSPTRCFKLTVQTEKWGSPGWKKKQSTGSGGKSHTHADLSHDGLQDLRLKVNGRERKRMHDLNQAMDGLREVMPYAQGPSVRKLSKISTLLLARNYILMLSSSLEEMKKLIGDVYGARGQSHSLDGFCHQLRLLRYPSCRCSRLPHLCTLWWAALPSTHLHTDGGPCPSFSTLGWVSGFPCSTSSHPLKDPLHLSSSYRHFPGMPCPCSLCQPLPASTASLHSSPWGSDPGEAQAPGWSRPQLKYGLKKNWKHLDMFLDVL